MRIRTFGVLTLFGAIMVFVFAFSTARPSAVQANSNGSNGSTTAACNYDVTSILNNTDSNNVPLQFQSDGLGPYTASNGKNDSVKSMIDKNCAWSLDTTASKSRGISVTLAYPYSSGSPAPFNGPQVVKGRINTHCPTNTGNNGVDVGDMTFTGQTLICPLNVAFYYNNVWYNVALNPYNWSGTTMAQVTCTGASGGQCNAWTMTPDPATSLVNPATNQRSSIGELTLPPCVGCGGGTALGEYYFAYSFMLHK
jgi:hypothetical protein